MKLILILIRLNRFSNRKCTSSSRAGSATFSYSLDS